MPLPPDGHDIRLVKQAGEYGALIGVLNDPAKPLSAPFGVWQAFPGEVFIPQLENGNPAEADGSRKLCRYNLEIVNMGNAPWEVGNVFNSPEHYILVAGGPRWLVIAKDLWAARLYDSGGNDVVKPASGTLGAGVLSWGGAPLGGPSKEWGWLEVGINPGAAATTIEPFFGQYIDLTGVPNGDYTFELELDPLGKWGFDKEATSIEVDVEFEALQLRPKLP